MLTTYTCPKEEWQANSKIPFRVMATEEDMYVEMGRLMADTITENNRKNEKTVILHSTISELKLLKNWQEKQKTPWDIVI